MSTQPEMQAIEESQPPRKRRVRNIPDALGDQYLKPSRDPDADAHGKPTPKVQTEDIYEDLAIFTARLDAAAASFLMYAFAGLDDGEYSLTSILPQAFTNLDERIKDTRHEWDWASSTSIFGCPDPSAFLQRDAPVVVWGYFDALSDAALSRYSDQPCSTRTITVIGDVARTIESSAHLIPELLAEVVARKPLEPLVMSLMRKRWNRIDTFLKNYHDAMESSRGNDIPTWKVRIGRYYKEKDNHIRKISPCAIECMHSDAYSKSTSHPANLYRPKRISSSLWLSLLASLVTIPTTALAWQYSLHQPGTPKDADFWFQIQNSCMIILNFAILAIPIWRSEALPARMSFWVWGLLISASLCVGFAPVVYLFGPTEWSCFMIIAAGIVQAFMTLQIALVADSAANAGTKNVKED